MNGTKRNQFTWVRMAMLLGMLTLTGAGAAYAQTGPQAVAKMTISGMQGDNADGTIEVVGIEQQVTAAVSASGVAGGRATMALLVTKKIDRATPGLFLAVAQGRPVPVIRITWTRIDPTTNREEFSHSITLHQVMITQVSQRPADRQNPESRQMDEYEDIRISARIVEWDYALPGGQAIVRVGWDFVNGVAR